MNRPSASVTAVLSPVGPTTDTLAPATTAPVGSVTVPPRFPFTADSCANPIAVRLKVNAKRAKTATSLFAISFNSSLKFGADLDSFAGAKIATCVDSAQNILEQAGSQHSAHPVPKHHEMLCISLVLCFEEVRKSRDRKNPYSRYRVIRITVS